MKRHHAPAPPSGAARSIRRHCAGLVLGAAVGLTGLVAAPSSASAAPSGVTAALSADIEGLTQGARGAPVAELQRALIALGIPVHGGADGVFGPATHGAVVVFQQRSGIEATGRVDARTSSALRSAIGGGASGGTASAGSGASWEGYVGLKEGVTGEAVKELQRRLQASGVYLVGGVTGRYDRSTTRGVSQYQGWNGLERTGSVNRATAKSLDLGSGSATNPSSSGGSGATAPPPSATSNPTSTNPYVGLAQGARGERVVALQKALQATGLVVRGGADGVFGPGTATALRALEQVNGLTRDAIVGEREASILGLGTTAAPKPQADNAYVGLAVGARGTAVRDLQAALVAAGQAVRGGADGVFGGATKSALASYQKALGLSASGSVDASTAAKLGLGTGGTPAPLPSGSSGSTTGSGGSGGSGPSSYAGLKRGDSGAKVKELQQALMNLGFVIRTGASGTFDGYTQYVVRSFQSVNGQAQTGTVSARDAALLKLGEPSSGGGSTGSGGSGNVRLDRFPVQGLCFFGDTWHAARGNGRVHEGVDIIAAEGKLLYAVVDGEVSKLYYDQPGLRSGNGLRIQQPDGTYFTYLHMQGFATGIEVGTKVKAGDVIGTVGNTGSSATAHLHLEIHPRGGGAINPYPYVKAIDGCKNTKQQWQASYS